MNRETSPKMKYNFAIGFLAWFVVSASAFSPARLSTLTNEEDVFVYKSYTDSMYCQASSPILAPKTVSELQEIIRNASQAGKTVKLLGGRNSLTDVICTEGIPVSTEHFNAMEAHADNTVTFGAGLQLADGMAYLQERNLTLPHIPTFGGITIGGAIGTGAHGSSLKHWAALSDQVVKVTLVDGSGQIRTIQEGDDGNDFRAVRVHLGLVGALVNVTLRTVSLFKMTIENTPENEIILLDGTALAEAREHDVYQMWWFPHTRTVVASRGNYHDAKEHVEGNAVTNLIPPVGVLQAAAGRQLLESMQQARNLQQQYQLEEQVRDAMHQESTTRPLIFYENVNGSNVFVNPATGYAWKLLANRCSGSCPWEHGNFSMMPEESAMAFDIEELPNVVRTIQRILLKYPAGFPMVGIFIRFTKGSSNLMALNSGRDTVHIEWATPMRTNPFTTAKLGIATYQATLQAMVEEHGGRPHWGKNGPYFFTNSVLDKVHPNIAAFREVVQKYDPSGIFMNKFGRRLFDASDELNVDPSVRHCALQDYCMCQTNADCSDRQHCEVFEGKYNVCVDGA